MLAGGIFVSNDERRILSTVIRNFVMSLPCDGGDGGADIQIRSDFRKGGKRGEVVPHDLLARGQGFAVRGRPARTLKQVACRRIDVVGPREKT